MVTDSPKEPSTFYSADPRLPSELASLPPGTSCKLCQCHSNAHVVYWQCPLLDTYICCSCCQEEVPSPDNLNWIQKVKPEATSEAVTATCNKCGRNSLA